MQQGEGELARIESFQCQMQHHGRVFANGIEHHRLVKFSSHFPDYMNTLSFQLLEMCQTMFSHVNSQVLESEIPRRARV